MVFHYFYFASYKSPYEEKSFLTNNWVIEEFSGNGGVPSQPTSPHKKPAGIKLGRRLPKTTKNKTFFYIAVMAKSYLLLHPKILSSKNSEEPKIS